MGFFKKMLGNVSKANSGKAIRQSVNSLSSNMADGSRALRQGLNNTDEIIQRHMADTQKLANQIDEMNSAINNSANRMRGQLNQEIGRSSGTMGEADYFKQWQDAIDRTNALQQDDYQGAFSKYMVNSDGTPKYPNNKR